LENGRFAFLGPLEKRGIDFLLMLTFLLGATAESFLVASPCSAVKIITVDLVQKYNAE